MHIGQNILTPFTFLTEVVLFASLVKEFQDEVQVLVSFQSCRVVLVEHQILDQVANLGALLRSEGKTELAIVLLGLLLADGLQEEIQGEVLLVLVDASLDQCVVGHIVWHYAVRYHPLVHLDGLIYHLGLNQGLNHASVNEHSGFHIFSLHLVQNSEGFFNLTGLLIDLCQNGVSDIARLDL